MGVGYGGVLVVGWQLDANEVRELLKLIIPEATDDNYKQIFAEMPDSELVTPDGWYLVRAGSAYGRDSTDYYLSAFSGDEEVDLEELVRGGKRMMKAGRKLATRIGILPIQSMRVFAVAYVW